MGIFEPLTADNYGSYFPLRVINTGDKDLNNVSIKVKTCYMDSYKQMQFTPILKKGTYTSPRFWEEKTMSLINKKLCLPEYNSSFHNCQIEVYIINSTTLYAPQQ